VLKELDREQPLAELYRAAPPAGEPRGPEDGKTRNDAVVRSSPLLRAALRTNVVLSDTAVASSPSPRRRHFASTRSSRAQPPSATFRRGWSPSSSDSRAAG